MQKTKLFSTRRLVTDAMLVALFFVLTLPNIEIAGVKLTLDALPVVLAAILFSPVDGLLVGLLGAFLEQMLHYGFTVTTLLWILPASVRGLLVGLGMRKKTEKRLAYALFVFIAAGLVSAVLNTAAYYIDSKLFGYYNFALIFGVFGWRLVTGAVVSAATGVLALELAKALKKTGMIGA